MNQERRGTDQWILSVITTGPRSETRETLAELSEAKDRLRSLCGDRSIWQARVLSAKNPKRTICYLWGGDQEFIDFDRRTSTMPDPRTVPMPE